MTGLLESAVRKLSFVWPTTEVSPHSAGYEGVPRVWPFNATEKLDPDVRELLSMHCSWCVLDCGEPHHAKRYPPLILCLVTILSGCEINNFAGQPASESAITLWPCLTCFGSGSEPCLAGFGRVAV